jgi:hypothetical protein
MIALDTTQHESISENTKLSESLFPRTFIAKFLNGVQELLVEDRDMLHTAMVAVFATILFVHIPIESRAWTLLAKVAGERTDVEETDKREELADAVLQWGSRQAPFVICLESKASLGTSSSSLLRSS